MESTNIRNVVVAGHVKHGKTVFTKSLVSAAGISPQEDGNRFHSLCYDTEDHSIKTYEGDHSGTKYLINLIDTAGHIDFSADVTTALRISDGVIVLVDCIDGVSVQTESVLRQAVHERVKPTLAINKVELCFLEMQDGEHVYQIFLRVIENSNAMLAMYADNLFGDLHFQPEMGTVIFVSGLQRWGFNLKDFARFYSSKFDVTERTMMERLWGENYYDMKTKTWSTKFTGSSTCKRGFVHFCFEPIRYIATACLNGDFPKVSKFLKWVNVRFNEEEKNLSGSELMKLVLQRWFPLATTTCETIVDKLPSPFESQRYRVNNLYPGDLDGIHATAIRNCDPNGPLMLYISRMVPTSERGSKFYALGRVFSGKVKKGMTVRVMGPNYVHGQKNDLLIRSINKILLHFGNKRETVDIVQCGNIVAIPGLDTCINKTATLTNKNEVEALPIRGMKFSVSPVVRVAVKCVVHSNLPKLVQGLKLLSKSDALVTCENEETGELVVAGAGELHVNTCLRNLQRDYVEGAELIFSRPVVSFRETVLERSKKPVKTYSGTTKNKLAMQARPLEEGLAEAIDDGELGPRVNPEVVAAVLSGRFGWNNSLAKKIWCFGPDTTGPNILLDASKGVQYLNDIKESVVVGFGEASCGGALAGEKMRGICFEIAGEKLDPRPLHRQSAQIISITKRSILNTQLLSKPRLMEPIYLVSVQAPEQAISGVNGVLRRKRAGRIVEERFIEDSVYSITAYVPVIESFELAKELQDASAGQATCTVTFDHWKVIEADPLECGTHAEKLVNDIRNRKGMEKLKT